MGDSDVLLFTEAMAYAAEPPMISAMPAADGGETTFRKTIAEATIVTARRHELQTCVARCHAQQLQMEPHALRAAVCAGAAYRVRDGVDEQEHIEREEVVCQEPERA